MKHEAQEQKTDAVVNSFPRPVVLVALAGILFSLAVYLLMPADELAAPVLLIVGLALTALISGYLKNTLRRSAAIETELNACVAELSNSRENAELVGAIDRTTGLFNRTHFDNVTANECRRAVREFSPLSLMLIEVDYLDHYRKEKGEAEGENCLKQIAEDLRKCISRPGDLAVRFDNERFALLLPSTNEQVAQLAARCCADVRSLAIRHPASAVSDIVTVTIGVATMQPSRMLTPERLIEAAEKALYDAQKAGRNQYIASTENVSDLPSVTYSL
ncbi:diguanylate cyclase [Pontibacterium granulatum]|uniref:diguanylate cyclase domain-containing protein n=1 Tax=Pontibacterium granulatum TaxID=2036029 RepID=UPI00249A1D16|nr:diguanylate cyclase [Pontibacterium granulatum]MDI3323509.1 diguanylate cyclase [Pontibacterium granulatum]